MTSSDGQQNPNSAPNSSSSYAAAAGSSKKPSNTPANATGSSAPVVAHGDGSSAQNGKPMNGRPTITPAVPVAPIVARGTPNGGPAHDRKSSVTIPANIQNGGAGGARPKFGFQESPGEAHSTPQPSASAPIAIPGNARVPSPAASPAPIPQQSGGQQRPAPNSGNVPTFGSFPGEGDRHMKSNLAPNHGPAASPQTSHNFPSPHPHYRSGSQASVPGDMSGPGHHPRGGYGGGRGRGNFNGGPNNAYPGYPPNRQFQGPPSGGRGGYTSHGGRGGMQYPNSPQRGHASPATTPGMAHVTPVMAPAGIAGPPTFYPQQMYPHQPQQMNGPYPPQYGGPMMQNYGQYPPQQVPPYMAQNQMAAQGFQQFQPPPYSPAQPGAQPMSRNPSQVSDRPASSTGPSQPPPVVQGTPTQPRAAQTNPPVVSGSSTFVRPKKSAAIQIKRPDGEKLDLSSLKAPPSPAPNVQSKTPPVVSSTPTPPPKSSTPSHTRTDSTANKTKEQVALEFKSAVAERMAKDEEEAKLAAEKVEMEKAAEDERQKEEARKEAERVEAEQKAKAQEEAKAAKAAEEAAKAEQEAAEKQKAEAEAKAKADAEAEAEASKNKATEQPKAPGEMTEEELEAMFAEMEAEDARREAEQKAISDKKKAEAAEKKKAEDANRAANAAEADRKLKEQEAEMERLEEERERKRNATAGGKAASVNDLLAKKVEDLAKLDKESAPPTPSSISDKFASMSTVSNDGAPSAGGKANAAAEKQRAKPAALNLAPLNTKQVEPPQPSAAIQSLKSARFLEVMDSGIYPEGIRSPNPALNAAVSTKGKSFKYDAGFLLQFQKVFIEQPSVEFHQQVKSLIGDPDGRSASARSAGGPNRSNSRPGAASGFSGMGQFGAPAGARPIPPGSGLGSDQRFAMSQGTMARPNGPGGAMSFGRGGFPGPVQMSRTPSSTNMGGIPNSPRTGSRRGSKRPDHSKGASVKDDRSMPLTQGLDLKPITTSASGWKPTSIGKQAQGAAPGAGAQSAHMDPEMVQRKVKAALNKMTPEKFDKIADQILVIASQSKNEQDGRTLRQVIQLTFEKATDESHWASMYAKFCKRMLDTMSAEIRDENILDKNGNVVSGGALFRKYLLNRCQEEFERGWKVDLPEPKEGDDKKAGEAVMLSDEYYIAAAAKRRGLGLVQFIGELYKLGMLTERIMHECVRKLLEFQGIPDEAEIESLTKLLRTIGSELDRTEKGHPMMDVYFQRISSIIDLPELPSRLKFMLMDIVDLRRANWVDAREVNKGPKTLKEIQADAEAAQAAKAAENARNSQRGGPGGRPPAGRGDARNFTYNQGPPPNTVGMDDLRRLKGSANRSSSQNVSFGPTSMFNSRSNSGRRLGSSFARPGEDSNGSSRTGTPPTRERESIAHTNTFASLAVADTGEHPGSPPSTAASPALSKSAPDTADDDKKED